MYEVFVKLMALRGVNMADVAKATGIGQSTLSNWKRRNNLISGKNAKLIADYFGVTVDYLMTGEDMDLKDVITDDNEDVKELAAFLYSNPEYKVLFDACQKVKRDDIRFVQKIIERVSR